MKINSNSKVIQKMIRTENNIFSFNKIKNERISKKIKVKQVEKQINKKNKDRQKANIK